MAHQFIQRLNFTSSALFRFSEASRQMKLKIERRYEPPGLDATPCFTFACWIEPDPEDEALFNLYLSTWLDANKVNYPPLDPKELRKLRSGISRRDSDLGTIRKVEKAARKASRDFAKYLHRVTTFEGKQTIVYREGKDVDEPSPEP